ncbi:hypothetical protein DPMN_176204 [Dreissena polymorpha]|uniref:Uncharacterized protein n=1 Tax=Dreissena polymorpha TaxID=45954 RepID=A0A9D4E7V6_DREPO|nr:hypothetical protein DPMN_176204 [Dreissena polymorpha]
MKVVRTEGKEAFIKADRLFINKQLYVEFDKSYTNPITRIDARNIVELAFELRDHRVELDAVYAKEFFFSIKE